MRGAVSPQDQISELNKKLQLHEGDLKAYIEVIWGKIELDMSKPVSVSQSDRKSDP